MADTAHKSDKEMEEHFEEESAVVDKAKELAGWIREAKHFTVFTGAGISTAAGIPDFRGPQGVWTLRAKGEKRKKKGTNSIKAIPTYTHMALIALEKAGYLKHLISQNTDGLHRKSGFPIDKLSELHGNSTLEVCSKCGHEYLRDFRVRNARKVHDHKTGRVCKVDGCGGDLKDTIINFGENLPEKPLNDGFAHSERSDLCVVLGSSLRVTPAADMPGTVAENGYRLVVNNLQETPYDDVSAMVVHAKCDEFMRAVMEELEVEVPEWRLRRHIVLTQGMAKQKAEDGRADFVKVGVKAIDRDGTPASVLQSVGMWTPPEMVEKDKAEKQPIKLTQEPFAKRLYGVKEGTMQVTLEFMGHYEEPEVTLELEVDPYGKRTEKQVDLAYDPWKREWTVEGDGGAGSSSGSGGGESSSSGSGGSR